MATVIMVIIIFVVVVIAVVDKIKNNMKHGKNRWRTTLSSRSPIL